MDLTAQPIGAAVAVGNVKMNNHKHTVPTLCASKNQAYTTPVKARSQSPAFIPSSQTPVTYSVSRAHALEEKIPGPKFDEESEDTGHNDVDDESLDTGYNDDEFDHDPSWMFGMERPPVPTVLEHIENLPDEQPLRSYMVPMAVEIIEEHMHDHPIPLDEWKVVFNALVRMGHPDEQEEPHDLNIVRGFLTKYDLCHLKVE